VDEAIEVGRRHGGFLELITLQVMTRLAQCEIPCATLKGPRMAEILYGDRGRRLSGDIDLLVAAEHLRAAAELGSELGYLAPTDPLRDGGLPLLHFVLVHEKDVLPPLELHWRVHWYERSFARERLLPATVDPLGTWRPSPADDLVALLLFYARDGFADLRLATDLSAWWDVFGTTLPPGSVDALLRRYPMLARVVRTSANVAEHMIGLPTDEIFEDSPALGVRERVATRLADPHPQISPSQLYADMGLIDGLLAPSGGLGAFIRRQLLPPREVRERHARHHAGNRHMHTRSSLGRAAGMLARYGLALARLAAPTTLCRHVWRAHTRISAP
jgi:hypothetical protein